MTIDLSAHEPLSREDEIRLAKRIEAGVYAAALLTRAALNPLRPAPLAATPEELAQIAADGQAAWQRFYLANLRLVHLIALRWTRAYRLEVEDAFQEGCLGLAQAIRRWDHTRGTTFCTTAWREITWRVRRHCIERGGTTEAPTWWLAARRDLQRQGDALRSQMESGAVVGELACQVGRTPQWVEAVMAWEPPASLPVLPEIPAPPPADNLVAITVCRTGLARLPALERRVIAHHFGLSGAVQTYAKLAESLGCSTRQVRRIEARGLERLREVLAPDDQEWYESLAA